MAHLLAHPRVLKFSFHAIKEPSHNKFNNFTHNPSYTSFHFYHHLDESSRACFLVNKTINPGSKSRDFPSPVYSYLCPMSLVQWSRDIIVHNIYRLQGPSPSILDFSCNYDLSDCYSVVRDSSDVFSPHNELLNTSTDHILLRDVNLHYSH
jgi:hypothetical protein